MTTPNEISREAAQTARRELNGTRPDGFFVQKAIDTATAALREELSDTKKLLADSHAAQQETLNNYDSLLTVAHKMAETANQYVTVRTIDPCDPNRIVAVLPIANRSKEEVLLAERKLDDAISSFLSQFPRKGDEK